MDQDHNDLEQDADQAAMARFLGFASFGSQNPPKKRKFNARTDAFVAGAEASNQRNESKAGHGSGGNSLPLGKARDFGKGLHTVVANDDEIDVDGDAIDTRDETCAPAEPETADFDTEDPGPAYIDTSRPPPVQDVSTALTPRGMVRSLPDGLPGEARTNTSTAVQEQSAAEPLTISLGQASTDLSSTAAPSHTQQRYHKSSRPDNRGRRNELWYVDYYDHSFNENPWAKCERERNLSPRGTWIQRPART